MILKEHRTKFEQHRAARALELKQTNAALMITKHWRGRQARQQLKAGMEYFKSTGTDLSTIPEDLQKMIHDLYDGLDKRVIQAVEKLEVMNVGYVKELVYELGQRVLDLEEAQAATTHFHFAKPDVDDSFASISVDMGKHTAPRDAIPIQLTPEKADDGIDPLFAEQIAQQLAEGSKKAQDIFSSPHNMTQDESMIRVDTPGSGKKPHRKHKKAEVTVLSKISDDEYQQKLKELQDIETTNSRPQNRWEH